MAWKKLALVTALVLVCGFTVTNMVLAQSPDELGKIIADTHLESMKKINELMKDRPVPQDLAPKVDALKEETIKKLVELGKKVAALDPAGLKKVESKVAMAFSTVPPDVFKAYTDGQAHYFKADNKLAKEITSFNIITQYAFYDLLKKQDPKEAERLGIK
jgi:hypothetical protein